MLRISTCKETFMITPLSPCPQRVPRMPAGLLWEPVGGIWVTLLPVHSLSQEQLGFHLCYMCVFYICRIIGKTSSTGFNNLKIATEVEPSTHEAPHSDSEYCRQRSVLTDARGLPPGRFSFGWSLGQTGPTLFSFLTWLLTDSRIFFL